MTLERNEDLPRYGLYIDGCWTDAANGATIPVMESALGRPMAYVPTAVPKMLTGRARGAGGLRQRAMAAHGTAGARAHPARDRRHDGRAKQ